MAERGEVVFAVIAGKVGNALAQHVFARPVEAGDVAAGGSVAGGAGKIGIHIRGDGRAVADKAVGGGKHRAMLGDVGERIVKPHRFKAGKPAQEVEVVQGVFQHVRTHFPGGVRGGCRGRG